MESVYDFLDYSPTNYLMKYPFLETFEVKKWILSLKLKARGKSGFSIDHFKVNMIRFKRYLEFVELTPKELIDEVENDEKKNRRIRENPAGNHLMDFFSYLKQNKLSPATCESYVQTIRGFYKHNGFPISIHIPKQDGIKTKIELTKELIRKFLSNVQKLRDKVIVLIMVSSGMSINDVLDLEYRHIKKLDKPLTIKFRRLKNNQKYITFISSECVEFLINYLDIYRKNIKDLDKVFIGQRKPKLDYLAVYKILNRASKLTVGNSSINSKAFRRFFISEMKMSGISSDIVEFWVGHNIGVARNYMDVNKLREVYKEYEDVVTIYKEVVSDEGKIREEIKTELEEMIQNQDNRISKIEELVFRLIKKLDLL